MTSNGRRRPLTPFFDHPGAVCAAAALAVRLALGFAALKQNPLLRDPQLDSDYYVTWAREIAAGDLASAHGIVSASVHGVLRPVPFILNPLYAYVLAPVVALFANPALPVIVFQALLAAGTAAMTAVAARRFFGRLAGWTAGIAVAFSTVLVQLDLHVAVSGLAAFLTAGAVLSSAPPREGSRGRGHGPVAAGIWLGLGALARPIAPVALPFYAWKQFTDGAPRRLVRVLLLIGVFAACVLPSFLRNWIVGGEPVPFTTAAGLNLHLGNNPVARRYATMQSDLVRFSPIEMHEDAWRYVAATRHLDLSRSEVSSYFTNITVEEFRREPAASAAFYAQKARWFFAPAEVPSTSSLANDLRFTPLLRIAFVPAWLLAAAALVGAVLHCRRDVLLGPGAMVLAHVVVLTLVFPLSHYRSPAIPAMAVLAGGAVQWIAGAWSAGARGRAAAAAAGVLAIAALAAVPPQPDPLRQTDAILLAVHYRDLEQWDEAERWARSAIDEYHAQGLNDAQAVSAFKLLADISFRRKRWPEAIERYRTVVTLDPNDWRMWLALSMAAQAGTDPETAESAARHVTEAYPQSSEGYLRLADVLTWMGRGDAARDLLRDAMRRGVRFAPEALRRFGL